MELWLGRAGTGKSTCVATEIAERIAENPVGGKIYWIVPETASFAAERLLMKHVRSTIRAEVITLSRLAQRLEQQLPGVQVPVLNLTGRRLLLADVLRSSADSLDVLQRAKPTLSLLDSILDTFDEMAEHLISLDGVESALQVASARVNPLGPPVEVLAGRRLLGKLHDLCVLYARYQSALRTRGLADPAERVSRVAPSVPELPLLDGCEIYFDGFRDMKLSELQFALGLAAGSDRAAFVVSADALWFPQLTVDARSFLDSDAMLGAASLLASDPLVSGNLLELLEATGCPGDVFAPEAIRYVHNVLRGCARVGVPVAVRKFPDVNTAPATAYTPMLQRLEQTVIGDAKYRAREPLSPLGSVEAITLAGAQNVRAEAEGVARDILHRVHSGSCRFRDIAVAVPDLPNYTASLQVWFARYQIPIDIADAPSLTTYPLAKFLLGAMLAVEDNLSTDSVIRLLKTEFFPVGRDDADWLEDYLIRHQVDGPEMWKVEWTFAVERADRVAGSGAALEDLRANRLRAVLDPLLQHLVSNLEQPELTPAEVADALWALLEAVNARRRVATWLVDDSAAANPHEAALHEQAWQRLMAILTDLKTTLPDAVLPRRFVFQSIRTDIDAETLAGIPTGLDSVLVLDMERAAHVHTPVTYLVGVTDGTLPRRIRSTGLLQDDERAQFYQLFGQRLGDSAEERQLAERYRVYAAVTRATRVLVITYPLADGDGKELRPSNLMSQIRNCFPATTLSELWWQEDSLAATQGGVITPNIAQQWVLSSLREYRGGSPLPAGVSAVFRWLHHDREYGPKLARALRGLSHRANAQPLRRETAVALYGRPLRMNAYQLETMAACPYKHFAQYGLRLREPERGDVTAAERGTLIHAALAEFVERHRGNPEAWRELNDEQTVHAMNEVLTDLLAAPNFNLWSRTATRRQQAAEAGFMAQRAAVVLTRHVRHSQFVPFRLELSFGTNEDGALPPYKVLLGDGSELELRGRLDRVDFASSRDDGSGQTALFRIVDYKSRVMKLDLNRLYHGLSLQLAVYSQVIRDYSEALFGSIAVSAGVYYQPLVRRFETQDEPIDEAEAFEQAMARMKVRGLWLADETALEWMDSRLTTGGQSELFPKMFKRDGSFVKNAPVLDVADWARMEETVRTRVEALATTVLSGDIRISPYAFDRYDEACNTCAFAAVCQIDKRWDSQPFRRLAKLPREEVLTRWREDDTQ